MIQVILTLIFYVLLIAILVLVTLMWRSSVTRTEKLQQALIDATKASTTAAKESAEAVRILADKEHPRL